MLWHKIKNCVLNLQIVMKKRIKIALIYLGFSNFFRHMYFSLAGCSRYNLLVVRSNFDSFIVHYPLILPTTLIWCQYRLWRHSLSIWQITSGTSWLSVSLGTNFKSSSIVSKSIFLVCLLYNLERAVIKCFIHRTGAVISMKIFFAFQKLCETTRG